MWNEKQRERYEIVPQMRIYDELPIVLTPYVSVNSSPRFRSAVVNTDGYGFRHSSGRHGIVDTRSWWQAEKRGLVLGGSFVFGDGATNDGQTIPSVLNSLTDYSFLNLGIRSGNSTQELIAAIPFLESADCVVVCSGINNLSAWLRPHGENDLFGPLLATGATFQFLASYSIYELAALVRSQLGGVRFQELCREAWGRMLGKLGRTDTPSPTVENCPQDTTRVAEEAIRRQQRDLSMVAKTVLPHAKLFFAAQPFTEVCRPVLTPEELQLFNILETWQGPHWRTFKKALVELWPSYVNGMQAFCAGRQIPFVDLNAVEYHGWAFVDRVHMTDAGYRQVAARLAMELS